MRMLVVSMMVGYANFSAGRRTPWSMHWIPRVRFGTCTRLPTCVPSRSKLSCLARSTSAVTLSQWNSPNDIVGIMECFPSRQYSALRKLDAPSTHVLCDALPVCSLWTMQSRDARRGRGYAAARPKDKWHRPNTAVSLRWKNFSLWRANSKKQSMCCKPWNDA